MGSLFDLERHYAFYGAYHSDPVNILIHTLLVWPIFFTSLLLYYFIPPFLVVAPAAAAPLVFNLGFAFAALYAVFYVLLDPRAGSIAALLCALCWVGSCILGSHLGFSLAWKVVLAAQLLCWSGQFIGHGVFEGRAPALLDNLSQAFLMAPFFVLLEVLHRLFSYEPYPGFHASVQAKIEAEQKEWQASKQKKSS
uniref:Putative endoplasmic reticulum membrane protein C16E8.02 n=1 Tax=Anthurium amnicola TaxID=1678845 RepID=A0A1D1YZV0_9ARAE